MVNPAEKTVAILINTERGATPENLFTIELGIGDNYEVKIFTQYYQKLHQILAIEPIQVLTKTKAALEELLALISQFNTELTSSIPDSAKQYQTDSMDAFTVCIKNGIAKVDEFIRKVEEINPTAAISGVIFCQIFFLIFVFCISKNGLESLYN